MNSGDRSPICLWSGPRNVSTAMMYSFAQLDDVAVVDEPLYGHYLRITGRNHPGREQVMASMNCDGELVMQSLIDRSRKPTTPRLFLKHMAHHLVELDSRFLHSTCNVFLIRDPLEMLPSLTIQLPDADLADTGLKKQWELFVQLRQSGATPVVVDSRELLLNPDRVLRQLCHAIGISYSTSMLEWPAGPREEDGVWATHWYHAVHTSRGFDPYREKTDFPVHLQSLLDECVPWYQKLKQHALRAIPEGDDSESARSA